MRLFLDSANLNEIADVASWGVLSGVTTNPTLLAQEDVDPVVRVAEICRIVPGLVTASVVGDSRDELVALGRELAAVSESVVVQFPVGLESLAACRILSEAGVRVSMILVFSAAQAVLCANAGAAYVVPFLGRLDDIGADGLALLEEMAQIFAVQGYPTELVAMSLRSPAHVIGAARAGTDIASIPYDVFLQMVSNPLTDLGSERFSEDGTPLNPAIGGGYGAGTPVPPTPTGSVAYDTNPTVPGGFDPGQAVPGGTHGEVFMPPGNTYSTSEAHHSHDGGTGPSLSHGT